MDAPPTQPNQTKVVEIRAVSASGAGVWSRVGENPICTALVAQEWMDANGIGIIFVVSQQTFMGWYICLPLVIFMVHVKPPKESIVVFSNDDWSVSSPPKRKVFRFHETILRR